MSCILGENGDVFFPKVSAELSLVTFSDIAVKYLQSLGYEAYLCESEDEARTLVNELPSQGKWPCLFSQSNTTGEKDFEEFYTEHELLDMQAFINLGVIKNTHKIDTQKLVFFENEINRIKSNGLWKKDEIVELFFKMIPDFDHKEVGKYLDSKM